MNEKGTAPAMVTIREKSGNVIRANIHGNGGAIPAHAAGRLLPLLIERATAGEALQAVYEPEPGMVRAYIDRAAGYTCEGRINLAGAVLISVE